MPSKQEITADREDRLKVIRAESPWMDIHEAAAYACLGTRTLREYAAAGRLHFGGTERKRLIHRAHLDEQIQRGFPPLGLKKEAEQAPTPTSKPQPKTRRKKITRVV